MFSDEITTTDAFLDMPGGSQLLYFHLGINADDDGFISSPKMIMRAIGASDDELKILYAKKFLLPFPSGVCVVKHWRINNQIRKDRYTETVYTKEKMQLFIRDNGSYSFNPENALPVPRGHFLPSGNQLATSGQPLVAVVEESRVELSKGKVSKVEASIKETSVSFLENLPPETLTVLSDKYHISTKGVQSKATDLLLYCRQKGKTYKDYKAFLENALRKDKIKLQSEYPYPVAKSVVALDTTLTPEQVEANRVRIDAIKMGLAAKFKM
jgi:hypothetical protein